MADLITDEKELNDVALSLQTVMLNANADHFDLVPADMSTSFGIALLEPGYVVQSAPIQITYKAQ